MKYLYVANWKMNMHVHKAIEFCVNNFAALQAVGQHHSIVLCPSFVALAPLIEQLKATPFAVGGQNCSQYDSGSYTGQVSARSLAEVGCTYCIVGHSEVRHYYGDTNQVIAQKVEQLYINTLQPIICIGETEQEYKNNKTHLILQDQLNPILSLLKTGEQYNSRKLIIAYEPVWAIGTGVVPAHDYLAALLFWLDTFIHEHLPSCSLQLLYGGSVDPQKIKSLKAIPDLHGFLIGGASTDFQKLKAIIEG